MMKVLIIDNKQSNIEFAKKQFSDFKEIELTTVSSFKEFDNLFIDRSRREGAATQIEKIKKYDVVLTDLMMPASDKGVDKYVWPKYVSSQMPYGFIIAMFARYAGVSKVAILTNSGHHETPLHWAMDCLPIINLLTIKGELFDEMNIGIDQHDSYKDQEAYRKTIKEHLRYHIDGVKEIYQKASNNLGILFLRSFEPKNEGKDWLSAFKFLESLKF